MNIDFNRLQLMNQVPQNQVQQEPVQQNQVPQEPVQQNQVQQDQVQQDQVPMPQQNSPIPELYENDPVMNEMQEDMTPSPDTIINDDGTEEVPIRQDKEEAPEENIKVSKRALDDTSLLMDLRDSVQALGLAWYSDGFNEIEINQKKYRYTPEQKDMLIEAWSPVIQSNNIKVSPFFRIAVVEAMCSGPLLALAHQNRKYRLELEEAKAKLAAMLRDKDRQEPIPNDIKTTIKESKKEERRDNKNAWKIDENGYFIYGPDGASTSYIQESNRKEKAKLQDNYDKLVEVNGKAKVHRAFGLDDIIEEENEES